MSYNIPALSPGSAVPTIAELAALLAAGVPETDRDAAKQLLTQTILPWDLRSVAVHPQPRRLAELVYQALADELRAIAANARLARLAEIGCDRDAGRLLEEAVSLAVARYVRDRSAPTATTLAGYLDPARPYIALAPEDAIRAVDRVQAAWQTWEQDAKARYPRCWANHRLDVLHARTALGSARSGSFASASGPFHAFLVQAGESPQLIDVH